MRNLRVAIVSTLLASASSFAHQATGVVVSSVTQVRHFTPTSARYQYVPFEVPKGTGTLRITYQYDRADGANVVDLGLFEPGPLDLGTTAFRGYSGGAKRGVTLSAAETTAGYRPGPLPPGQWHVLLGLYKVGASGVEVTITIVTEVGPAAPPLNTTSANSNALESSHPTDLRPPAPKWYMGALHTHTLHSDGTLTPAALMRRFADLRFDFVALTDHNNTTHRYEFQRQHSERDLPLWIAGEEVTTPGGHASVWGLDETEWIDFRVSAGDPRIKDLVAAARRFGAVFSVNHPASTCVACGWTHDYVDGIDGIEISNGRHGEVAAAIALWDTLLRGGRRITAVGSSDWHTDPNPIDVANVRVHASSLTKVGILDAIRAGRVIVMRSARDLTPDIVVRSGARTARIGDSLPVTRSAPVVIDVNAPGMAGSRLLVIENGTRHRPVDLDARGAARVEHLASPGYVRFEIETSDGVPIAITNPVYLVAP